MSFKGKKAVVVGARDESLGQAISRALAKEGAQVCIWDINVEEAGKTAKEIGATVKKVDALNYDSVKKALDETIKELGDLDILVGTVGGGIEKPFKDYTHDFFMQQIQYSGVSMFNCAHNALGHFLGKGEGKMLFFTSSTGGVPNLAGYSVGKAMIESVMKTLVSETQGTTKININCILPGIVPTKLTKGFFEASGAGDVMLQALAAANPRGLNTQAEVATVALFLLSSDADRINGNVIVLN